MEETNDIVNKNEISDMDKSNEVIDSQIDDFIDNIAISYSRTVAIRGLRIAHNAFGACPKLKKIIIKK